VIISSVLHVLVLSIASSFFPNLENEEKVTIPRPIEVGFISGYRDSLGEGNSAHPPPKKAMEPEKETTEPVNRKIEVSKKNVIKTGTRKKEKPTKTTDESVIEESKINPSQIDLDVRTNGYQDTRLVGTGLYGTKEGIGGEGAIQNAQLAYPDYKINPKPRYPMIARRKGYEGVVLVRVWVLDNGRVGKVELEKSSSYKVLDDSALEAVKEWVFVPGKKGGVPISSWVTVPIKFQLSSG